MSNELKWEQPPDPNRGGWVRWKPMAETLKTHPGEWALIVENGDYRRMTSVRSCMAKYGCKVRIRKQPDNAGWHIWSMYPEA